MTTVLIAFRLSGRLKVMMNAGPSFAVVMVSYAIAVSFPAYPLSAVKKSINTPLTVAACSYCIQCPAPGIMSDSSVGLMDFLPSLGNSEAIAVGQGVTLPFRMKFNTLPDDQRPHSSTAVFTNAWDTGTEDLDFVREIVRRWRRV